MFKNLFIRDVTWSFHFCITLQIEGIHPAPVSPKGTVPSLLLVLKTPFLCC